MFVINDVITKIIYILTILGVLASCASAPQLPGETAATGNLAQDTINTISIYSLTTHGCSSVTVTDTRRLGTKGEIKANAQGQIISGSVFEEWTVNQCGTIEKYKIDYTADGKGGMFIDVSPLE